MVGLKTVLSLKPVDEEEAVNTVKACKKKSQGISVIGKHLTPSLFRTGVFPTRRKIANLIPVFKSGAKLTLPITSQFLY